MHDFRLVLGILQDVGPAVRGAGLLMLGYVLVRWYRARSAERHPVPEGLANWHDVGPDVAVFRKRAFLWGVVTLAQRAALLVGVLLVVSQLIGGNPIGRLTASDWELILGSALAFGVAAAITPLRRSLSDPLYSRPKDAIDERNLGVGGAIWLRFGVRAIFYPLLFAYGALVFFYMLYALVVGIVGAAFAVATLANPLEAMPYLLYFAVLWVASVAFTSLLRVVDRWSMRYLAQHGDSMLQEDRRPHFLYLRTFKDDTIDIRAHFPNRRGLIDILSLSRRLPFEEIIAWRFRHYGPFIAANHPSDPMATLGAAKVALQSETSEARKDDIEDEAWKKDIKKRVRDSLAVIVSAAPSELQPGIKWELELLATMYPDHPLVLLIPPRPRRSKWKVVLDFSARVLRSVLPFLRSGAVDATATGAVDARATGWDAFCDHVRQWPRFDGARQLNPTGATHLIVYVPGEGWSAWGAGRRTEWTYAVCIMQAMKYAEGRWRHTRNPEDPGAVASGAEPSSPATQGAPPGRIPPSRAAAPAAAVRHPIPETVRNAIWLMYAGMAIDLVWIVATMAQFTPSTSVIHRSLVVYWSIASLALWYWTAQRCRRGNHLGRVLAVVFFALACMYTAPSLLDTAGVLAHVGTVAFIATGLASVVLLWRPASKPHFTRNADKLGPSRLVPKSQRVGSRWESGDQDGTLKASRSPRSPRWLVIIAVIIYVVLQFIVLLWLHTHYSSL